MKIYPLPKKLKNYLEQYPCLLQVMTSTAGTQTFRWLVLREYGELKIDKEGQLSREEIRNFSYREGNDDISLAKAFDAFLKSVAKEKHYDRDASELVVDKNEN